MNTYTYWLNSPVWHSELLAVIIADSLTNADKDFKNVFGYSPAKSDIGVTINDGN